MRIIATFLAVCVVFSAGAAEAKRHPRHVRAVSAAVAQFCGEKYCGSSYTTAAVMRTYGGSRKVRRGRAPTYAANSFASTGFGGDLVSKARHYMGTNPTGWGHVWCGRFMAMIAPDKAAQVRNPNMARDWLTLPRTSAHVGAIAVLSRGRRGGHVGIVTGFDGNGNPIIVSGNHGRVVGEGVYPKSRVIGYVS